MNNAETAINFVADHFAGLVAKGLMIKNVKRQLLNKGYTPDLVDKIARLAEIRAAELGA